MLCHTCKHHKATVSSCVYLRLGWRRGEAEFLVCPVTKEKNYMSSTQHRAVYYLLLTTKSILMVNALS